MKKLLLISTGILLYFQGNAQLSKGKLMAGGSISYSQNSTTNINPLLPGRYSTSGDSYLSINARCGYFISDHFVIGIYGNYQNSPSHSKTDYIFNYPNEHNSNTITSDLLSGGVFSRYYHRIGASRFAFFMQLSVGYGVGTSSQKVINYANGITYENDQHSTISQATINFLPGITYFINNRFAVEASVGNVGYTFQETKSYNNNNTYIIRSRSNDFNAGVNFSSISLGFNYYFGGRTAPVIKQELGE